MKWNQICLYLCKVRTVLEYVNRKSFQVFPKKSISRGLRIKNFWEMFQKCSSKSCSEIFELRKVTWYKEVKNCNSVQKFHLLSHRIDLDLRNTFLIFPYCRISLFLCSHMENHEGQKPRLFLKNHLNCTGYFYGVGLVSVPNLQLKTYKRN